MFLRRTRLFAIFSLALSSLPTLAQGDLDPAGPPSATMKTLDQVEARIPITAAPNVTRTISEPGSYYLTGDWALADSTSTQAVRISADNVTLDLNGYSISRGNSSGSSAIWISAANGSFENITVRNGAIKGPWRAAFSISGVKNLVLEDLQLEGMNLAGIEDYADSSFLNSNAVFRNLQIYSDAGMSDAGINLFMTSSFQMENVMVRGTSNYGISIEDTSTPYTGTITNAVVADCEDSGIYAYFDTLGDSDSPVVISNASVSQCEGGIYALMALVKDSAAWDNDFFGIVGGTVINCDAKDNGNTGIDANLARGCSAMNNTGTGIDARFVEDCRTDNNSIGIAGEKVKDCFSVNNSSHGIFVGPAFAGAAGHLISHNVCRGNEGAGLHIADGGTFSFPARVVIKGNTLASNEYGLTVESGGCLILSNVAYFNTTGDYNIAAGNHFGPIVDLVGTASASAETDDDAMATLGTTDPFANFSY